MIKKSVRLPVKVKAKKEVEKLNTILVENFVKLQQSMTHLAGRFDNLSIQISKLLQLFEISAKSFADKLESGLPDIEKDKEFLGKLDKLLDQNKVIAKGLALMEDKLKQRVYGSGGGMPRPQQRPPMRGHYTPSTIERPKRVQELQ